MFLPSNNEWNFYKKKISWEQGHVSFCTKDEFEIQSQNLEI